MRASTRFVTHSLFRLKHVCKIRSLNWTCMVNMNSTFDLKNNFQSLAHPFIGCKTSGKFN